MCHEAHLTVHEAKPDGFMFLPIRAKKWQSRKDSNLNKMNQNHLCYRYTTGLRTVYNIRLPDENASRKSKKFAFFC